MKTIIFAPQQENYATIHPDGRLEVTGTIEQIESLLETADLQGKCMVQLLLKVLRTEKALEFYSKIADYKAPFSESKLYLDCGSVARKALGK